MGRAAAIRGSRRPNHCPAPNLDDHEDILRMSNNLNLEKEEMVQVMSAIDTLYDMRMLDSWPEEDVAALDSAYQKIVKAWLAKMKVA
jgi:hypothetical protein